jgi:5-methylcytosine-specific restriction endonuclease McrA
MGWDADIYASRHWKNLSRFVRFERARGYCEECGVGHGTISADGMAVVLLTCAHVNGESTDLRLENLRALCPRCHKLLDARRERPGAPARRQARLARSTALGNGRPTSTQAL